MSLLERLGQQITATAALVQLVAAHRLEATHVNMSSCYAHVSVDNPADFARWVHALDLTEFTAWLRSDTHTDSRAGAVALYATAEVRGVEVTVVGDTAELPDVTCEHTEFPLSALTPNTEVTA